MQAPGWGRRIRGGQDGDRPPGTEILGEVSVPQGCPLPCLALPQRDSRTSDRKEFMSQVWNCSWAKAAGSEALYHCCAFSKLSWVTEPSGKSNPLMSVRIFLERKESEADMGPGRCRPGRLLGGGCGPGGPLTG